MREFNLYLDFYNNKPIEWGVYERGYNLWDNKDYDKKRADKYLFATVCVRNGLIMGFFDVSLSDDDIKISKNDKMMSEICEFSVFKNDKEITKFQGSFIDALEYIKANFKVVDDERL